MSEVDTAKSRWDDRYSEGELACTQEQVKGDPIDYTQHPFLYQHSIVKPLLGVTEGNPSDMVAARFFDPPKARGLAIGCGVAFFEEWLVACGHVDVIDAYEFSPVAVELAKERLAAAGLDQRLRMHAGDVREAGLVEGSYDVVIVQAAIHHFFEIEKMFQFMRSMLRPGGILIYDEYVGPDHMQYESHVREIMDQIDDCLAPIYKFDHISGEQRKNPPYATKEQMLDMDPSEGVHASEILPLTYQYFDVLYRGDYGGTFMRPFFTGILPNFNFEDAKDQTVARLIVFLEQILIRNRVIPSHHTRVVARRREEVRPPFDDATKEKMVYYGWKPSE